MADRLKALTLLRKAEQDMTVLEIPPQTWPVPDEVWGFHAQQAAEKLIKSVLAWRDVPFPFTHRLFELADLLSDSGLPFPVQFELLLDLTPFAADLRYSELSTRDDPQLDRVHLLSLIHQLRQWVVDTVKP